MRNEWTLEDIKRLRLLFLQGKRLKVIAKEMGRTATALNKAISRFGFRDRGIDLPSPPIWNEKKPSLIPPPAPTLIKNDPTVEFDKVMSFLENEGVHIEKKGDFFFYEQATITKSQILLKANQIRLKKDLPILRVSYLMKY